MARTFVANWPFNCACCDNRYPAGTDATHNSEGDLVAVGCPNMDLSHDREAEVLRAEAGGYPTEAEQREARKTMCQKCFLVHKGECF